MAISVKVELLKTGQAAVDVFDDTIFKDEVTIGRSSNNDVVLSEPDVSSAHAKLFMKTGDNGEDRALYVTDLESSNGTFVEDTRVPVGEAMEIKGEQRIVIGSFLLTLTVAADRDSTVAKAKKPSAAQKITEAIPPPPQISAETPTPPQGIPHPDSRESDRAQIPEPAPIVREDDEQRRSVIVTERYQEEIKIKRAIHDGLIERLDLRRKDIVELSDDDLRKRTHKVVEEILVDLRWEIPEGLERDSLIKEVLDEALGLGPLEELLADDDCSEIMVNSYMQIYAERDGKLALTEYRFSSEQAVLAAIERILAPIGRRIDESSPMVDARLKDGSRVNAVIRPLTLQGPCITIRKFAKDPLTVANLVSFGSLSQGMADFLQLAVSNRLNIVISGGTGSGKTTLLNIISAFIPGE